MSVKDTIVNLLFPAKCPFCGRLVHQPGICPECERTLPWTEEEECCRRLPDGLLCAAPLFYEDAVRETVLRFKFGGASGLAGELGVLLARCAAEHFSGEFDTVTWVPLSRRRHKNRGHDQARLLAEAACRCWQTKPEALLRKTGDNAVQSELKEAAARRANVLGMYEAKAAAGKRILLIDDICTTGSTLGECARTLQQAGAESVMCVTLALTRKKKETDISENFDTKEFRCT